MDCRSPWLGTVIFILVRGILKQEGSDERFYRNNIRKANSHDTVHL
jgi:hypothetical protein